MNDQQAAEYLAGIESAMQEARWALPIDLAIAATEEVLQHPGALPLDGLTISGDHRPRHGRLYAHGTRATASGRMRA